MGAADFHLRLFILHDDGIQRIVFGAQPVEFRAGIVSPERCAETITSCLVQFFQLLGGLIGRSADRRYSLAGLCGTLCALLGSISMRAEILNGSAISRPPR
ncbi:hypothetical protein [Agrobacterium deltaense]|uniref:hypothetical protein n=1 Tax=Agrobacterium deltaense TaxID=1183412 RepID=UPI0013C4198A|nr:hypothetical protein [Agrobacterium deltaense]